MRLAAAVVVLACASPALAQTRTIEVRGRAEHRAARGETADAAEQAAHIDAQLALWRDAATRLQSLADVRALRLSGVQLEAYVAALVEPAVASGGDARIDGRVDIRTTMDPAGLARRFSALRKDQDASFELATIWTALQHTRDPRVFAVRQMVAQATAALARTQEATVGGRVPVSNGRQRATQLAEAALKVLPDSPDAHYLLGDLHQGEGDLAAAESEYRTALQLAGTSAGHRRLAETLRLQGRFDGAVAELRSALRLEPQSARAHSDLGIILGEQGKGAEAMAEYREAIRIDPDLLDAHNVLAIALARQGQMDQAAIEFREIVRIDPDSAIGYYNLATALADLDRDSESAAALREVIRINPEHYNARFNIGELLRIEGKYDEAAKQFREYLRLAPDNTPVNRRNIERARALVAQYEGQP